MTVPTLRGRRSLTMDERITHYRSHRLEYDASGCWLWAGKVRADGYGVVSIQMRERLVHQVFYEYFVGQRPFMTNLHHTCEVKRCCNPDHLELLTVADHGRRHESILDAARASARLRRAADHCQRGHPFSEINTIWTKQGWRRCRECENANRRARR